MSETLKTLVQEGTNLANRTGCFGAHEGKAREMCIQKTQVELIFPVALLSLLLAREAVSYQLNKHLACRNLPAIAAQVEEPSAFIDVLLKAGGGIVGRNGSYGPAVWPVILYFDTANKLLALHSAITYENSIGAQNNFGRTFR